MDFGKVMKSRKQEVAGREGDVQLSSS